MRKHNAVNERIKREYFTYLKEAKRQSEASVDAAAAAIARFEAYTRHRDFKTFHHQQAVAFKQWLASQRNETTGKPLSKATLHATLSHLKRFFQWLAGRPGYKSRFSYSDAEYFNVSEKDARIATARRSRPVPTVEQVHHVIMHMPLGTEIERRNRALVAFILLTGARDSAVVSARLKHIDVVSGCFYQDAREVKTKYSKTFTTAFFPVGEDIRQIVVEWVDYLRREKLWGHDDPLFPKTRMTMSIAGKFEHVQLSREHWANATPIRDIFKQAFKAAGLHYYHPHSLRHTLAQMGERLCQTPEQFKAWSQNLGHEGVLTTLFAYGTVPEGRQREIMAGLSSSRERISSSF
ncbi:site-specific tyrosine recombinase XerC [Afipia felis]|uniref:Site-specific tyrosine recombinase XerC n=1 Tax=Afipia felis TaxID=1035 RepID=A0A090MLS4_AFIFE|nr:tyrosine-type recombinase/integrase [Afipia felis]CEG08336.1 site-specific tyrosine recombinase XerC [Afipia felis]